MDFKKAALRSALIIGIIAVSVLIGIAYQNISVKVEKSHYPVKFEESVKKYSDDYGVPEFVIYAVIKCESDFNSALLSDSGNIGLMQVSPETLEKYKGNLKDNYDTGMLYDPDTNIKYGTYRLSKMYIKLGTWKSVYAAMAAGEEQVEAWLLDKEVSDIGEKTKPFLRDIPDRETEKFVNRLSKTAELYKSLYFEN